MFMDDILVYSKTKEEHASHLFIDIRILKEKQLFSIFQNVNFICLQWHSCYMWFLKKGWGRTLKDWADKIWIQTSLVIEVRSFVSLASCYHGFFKNFASTMMYLTKLSQNDVPFAWSNKYEKRFTNLKTILTTTPILLLSIEGKEFIVFYNASLLGLGVTLLQNRNFITYVLRYLKPHKRNYLTHDLELAMVFFALKIWRYCSYSAKCEVFTLQRSMQHIITQRDLNLWQQGRMELLKDYDMSIQYHLGKDNVVADKLSRKSCKNG